MKAIDERIASLVTDAGKGVAIILPLTEKYGLVKKKKKKNVALTGHGAMARLNRKMYKLFI